MRRAVAAGLLAVLVVAAGCVGGIGGTATQAPGSDGGAEGGAADADGTAGTATDGATADTGTVNFYLSDRPNDMDDFEHLNVTVTTVQFHLVDDADENASDGEETAEPTETAEANETAEPTETATATATPTITAVENDDADAQEATEAAEPTEMSESTETPEPTETPERTERPESGDAEEADEDEGEGEDGRWVTREVNATTVDLTELRGANATLVEQFDLPAGEYDQVRLVISETEGVLKDGSTTEVKLPSERLKLNQRFIVGDGEQVDFVYDISVHKAGKSGMYILRPVASESGTDVEIDRVGDQGDEDERGLDVRFTGDVSPGENATVRVTRQGEPVANATVTVDGVTEGPTNADGEFTFRVPDDAEKVEVEVTSGDAEGELEREFGDEEETTTDEGESGGDGGDGGDGQGNGPPN